MYVYIKITNNKVTISHAQGWQDVQW